MTAPWVGMADLRFAIRTLRRSPVFALGAVLTLALGIGANVAVFTFVKGLLLQPLPYPEPDRLVAVEDLLPGYPGEGLPVSYLNFEDWQQRQRVFSAMAIYLDAPMVLTGSGDAERAFGARVSAGLFRTLGVAPATGRTFTEEEDRLGGPPVVVISHGLWQQRFGGQPAVGRTLVVDEVPRTVIGVMPAGFDFPDATALWIPAAVDPSIYPRGRHSFSCLARLRDGVTPAAALAEMRGIARQLAAEYRADNEGVDVTLRALRGSLVPSGASRGFTLLMGTVALVLLIACANLANLMLARAATRRQEVAIRSALGASRGRIIGQALTESAVLAVAGMSLGLLAGAWGRDLLVALVPVELPAWLRFEIDGAVAAFALALAAMTTLIVGLAPAIRASRPGVSSALAASRTRIAGEGDRLRATLIVAEVALATVLLVGGGLMMRALATVLANDPGVRPANVWTARLAIPPAKYPAGDRQRAFYAETLDRVRALPGVLHASAVSSLPMAGSTTSRGIAVEGRPREAANEELLAVVCVALPDYFETIGIRLLRGRTFDARDGLPGTPPVAVVNETFVKRYLPPGDPIGRRVSLGDGTGDDPWMTVVGVTADVRHASLASSADAGLFLPYNQKPAAAMTLVVRTVDSPLSLTEPIRRAVAAVDRDRPLYAVRTFEQVMARSIWQSRLFTWLVGVFGAVALALAAVGIFSVISYSVTERTREMGLRLALGAAPGQLQWQVMRQGIGVSLTGLAIGLAGATAVARVLGSWLQGVSPTDPATYAAVALVLVGAAAAACVLPARRATRIDPMTALRGE